MLPCYCRPRPLASACCLSSLEYQASVLVSGYSFQSTARRHNSKRLIILLGPGRGRVGPTGGGDPATAPSRAAWPGRSTSRPGVIPAAALRPPGVVPPITGSRLQQGLVVTVCLEGRDARRSGCCVSIPKFLPGSPARLVAISSQ